MANKEALRELQQRLAQRLQTVKDQAPTRSWLAIEIAGHGFLLPLEQSGEIFPLTTIHPVPHAHGWFLGVANLRGQINGVVDLASFLGMPRHLPRPLAEAGAVRDAGRLVVFNARLQANVALLVDRLLGLRNPTMLEASPQTQDEKRPHFITQSMRDSQGRIWHEIDLMALASDEAFGCIGA